MNVPAGRTTVSEVDVHYSGSGTPLLLLHGIGGAAEAFTEQIGRFARQHRVLAWDAPGYAGSVDPPDAPALDDYVDAAARVLRDLDAAPAHLLGVSWGGVIATRIAVRSPEVVRSLVLADSSRGSGRTERARVAMLERARELERLGPSVFASSRGPRLVAPDADPKVTDRIVAVMSRLRPAGYRAAAGSMAATDHSSLLGEIAVPTLVLTGTEDAVTGPVESHALATGIPGARFAEIPGAGHAANQERPEEFNDTVLRFLGEIDSAGSGNSTAGGRDG